MSPALVDEMMAVVTRKYGCYPEPRAFPRALGGVQAMDQSSAVPGSAAPLSPRDLIALGYFLMNAVRHEPPELCSATVWTLLSGRFSQRQVHGKVMWGVEALKEQAGPEWISLDKIGHALVDHFKWVDAIESWVDCGTTASL